VIVLYNLYILLLECVCVFAIRALTYYDVVIPLYGML